MMVVGCVWAGAVQFSQMWSSWTGVSCPRSVRTCSLDEVCLDLVLPSMVCLDLVLILSDWVWHPAYGNVLTLSGVSPLTKSHGWRMELGL